MKLQELKFLFGFRNIGEALVFEKLRPKLRSYLSKAGITSVHYEFYGQLFYATVLLNLVIYFLFIFEHVIFNWLALVVYSLPSLVVIETLLLFIAMLVLWVYYSTLIYNRTKKIEEVLPFFLESVRINLESGMSFEEALLISIEPQFSVLEKEIEIVAEKSMTGMDIEDAFNEFAAKYKSPILEETVDLISVGLRGGANMTEILRKLVDSINMNNYLKKTVLNSVMGYVIFITIIATVIAPILFALSYNLLVIFEGFGEKLGTSARDYLTIQFETLVEREDFVLFSRVSLATISLFASLIITSLRKGNIKGGWKYIPLYVGIALVIYEVMFRLLTYAFGSVF